MAISCSPFGYLTANPHRNRAAFGRPFGRCSAPKLHESAPVSNDGVAESGPQDRHHRPPRPLLRALPTGSQTHDRWTPVAQIFILRSTSGILIIGPTTAPATGMSRIRWKRRSFRQETTTPQLGQPGGSVSRHPGRLFQGSWACSWLNARHTHPSRATGPFQLRHGLNFPLTTKSRHHCPTRSTSSPAKPGAAWPRTEAFRECRPWPGRSDHPGQGARSAAVPTSTISTRRPNSPAGQSFRRWVCSSGMPNQFVLLTIATSLASMVLGVLARWKASATSTCSPNLSGYSSRRELQPSETMRLRKVPIPLMLISTTSPTLSSGEVPLVPSHKTSPA